MNTNDFLRLLGVVHNTPVLLDFTEKLESGRLRRAVILTPRLKQEDVTITFAGEPIIASYAQIEHRADRPMRLRDRRRRARKLRKLCARLPKL